MKRFRVVVSAQAEADLDALYAYVADASGKGVAQRFIDRLRAYGAGLSQAPERGRRRDDLLPGLRLLGYRKRATIAFLVTEDEVAILRFLYRVRDFEALLSEPDSGA